MQIVSLMCQYTLMKVGAFDIHEPLPALQEPHAISLLLPWVDAGNVGTLAMSKLESYMEAKELGKLSRPGEFFDFTRYRPTVESVEDRRMTTIPNSHIYYSNRENIQDFLFLHLMEPHANAEEYIESIVQLLKDFGIKKYCRIGSIYSSVPHTRPLRVTGSPGTENIEALRGLVIPRRSSNYQGPMSIMSLVSEELEKAGIETLSLMVQLPQYLDLEEDFSGEARLLQVISALYDLPGSMSDPEPGRQQYMEISEQVEGDSEIMELVEQLEDMYDERSKALADGTQPPPLPPQVDKFLREIDQSF